MENGKKIHKHFIFTTNIAFSRLVNNDAFAFQLRFQLWNILNHILVMILFYLLRFNFLFLIYEFGLRWAKTGELMRENSLVQRK